MLESKGCFVSCFLNETQDVKPFFVFEENHKDFAKSFWKSKDVPVWHGFRGNDVVSIAKSLTDMDQGSAEILRDLLEGKMVLMDHVKSLCRVKPDLVANQTDAENLADKLSHYASKDVGGCFLSLSVPMKFSLRPGTLHIKYHSMDKLPSQLSYCLDPNEPAMLMEHSVLLEVEYDVFLKLKKPFESMFLHEIGDDFLYEEDSPSAFQVALSYLQYSDKFSVDTRHHRICRRSVDESSNDKCFEDEFFKHYTMDGWRVGCLLSAFHPNKTVREAASVFGCFTHSGVNSPMQYFYFENGTASGLLRYYYTNQLYLHLGECFVDKAAVFHLKDVCDLLERVESSCKDLLLSSKCPEFFQVRWNSCAGIEAWANVPGKWGKAFGKSKSFTRDQVLANVRDFLEPLQKLLAGCQSLYRYVSSIRGNDLYKNLKKDLASMMICAIKCDPTLYMESENELIRRYAHSVMSGELLF